jgi:GAF domain-containing protein
MALARIWLLMPERHCARRAALVKVEETAALHLVASAGLHTRTNGSDHYICVGDLKIGAIAATREAICTSNRTPDPRIPNNSWIQADGRRSVAGYPLLFRRQLRGVLGAFSTREMEPTEFDWLGISLIRPPLSA